MDDIVIKPARQGHDSRDVLMDGKHVGFTSLDSDKIRLQRCPECGRGNHAMAVMSGTCAWCGYDANCHEVSVQNVTK